MFLKEADSLDEESSKYLFSCRLGVAIGKVVSWEKLRLIKDAIIDVRLRPREQLIYWIANTKMPDPRL